MKFLFKSLKTILFVVLFQSNLSAQQQTQNPNLNFQQSPNQNFQSSNNQNFQSSNNQSFSSANQQTQNQSQSLQTFTTPNLLEGYRFGSFSPFSNYQQLLNIPSLPTTNTNNKAAFPPMKLGGLRAKITIDIDVFYPTSIEKENSIKNRLSRISLLSNSSNIEIKIKGKKALLNGFVDSEYELFLLQNLIALEPGIDEVIDNTKKDVHK